MIGTRPSLHIFQAVCVDVEGQGCKSARLPYSDKTLQTQGNFIEAKAVGNVIFIVTSNNRLNDSIHAGSDPD